MSRKTFSVLQFLASATVMGRDGDWPWQRTVCAACLFPAIIFLGLRAFSCPVQRGSSSMMLVADAFSLLPAGVLAGIFYAVMNKLPEIKMPWASSS